MDLLDNLKISDLNAEQQELAECVGIDAYKNLVKTYAGSSIYISKQETLTVGIRDRNIVSEFNGYNYRELARKYNLSERHIRNIVDKKIETDGDSQITWF